MDNRKNLKLEKKEKRKMNLKKLNLTVLLVTILVLVPTIQIVYASPLSTFYLSGGIYSGAPTYTLWGEGVPETPTYYAKNANGYIVSTSSNASQVIQKAVDGCNNGDNILFKKTSYHIDTQITIPKSISLFGEGISYTAFYQWTNNITMFKYTETTAGITIKDLLFYGAQDDGILLDFRKTVKYCFVENCKFYHQAGTCISMIRADGGSISFENKIIGNTINVNASGTLLHAYSSELWLEHNKFGSNGFGIVDLAYCPNLHVADNGFEHASLYVGYTNGFEIVNNWWTNVYDYAIWVRHNEIAYKELRSIINENIILDVEGVDLPTVFGIRLDSASNDIQKVDIKNNRIRITNASSVGIWMTELASYHVTNCTITGNDVSEVAGTGISFNFVNNTVRYNVGFVTENSGTATVTTGATVAHGLVATPTSVLITPTVTGLTDIYVSDVGASTFKINFAGGGSQTFYWFAEYHP